MSSKCGTLSECCPILGYLRRQACEQLSHSYQWELSHVWLSNDVNMPAAVAIISVRVSYVWHSYQLEVPHVGYPRMQTCELLSH